MFNFIESLPMRERGLKHIKRYLCIRPNTSLPMRERGLKHIDDDEIANAAERRSPCGSVD